MKKESLFLKYIAKDDDGKEIVKHFPNDTMPARIGTYTYQATRMGNAPTIQGSLVYTECLDELWFDRDLYAKYYNVFVEYMGERYYLDNTPTSSKDNTAITYKHELNFVSERIVLEHTYFLDVVTPNTEQAYKDRPRSRETKFQFYGNLYELVSRINDSLKFSETGYDITMDDIDIDDMEYKEVSFDAQYLSEVLNTMKDAFDVDYYFVGKHIHVGFFETQFEDSIEYGSVGGLLSVSRNNSNESIVDRITGVGGDKNIPYYYPNPTPYGTIDFEVNRPELKPYVQGVQRGKIQALFPNDGWKGKTFTYYKYNVGFGGKGFIYSKTVEIEADEDISYSDDRPHGGARSKGSYAFNVSVSGQKDQQYGFRFRFTCLKDPSPSNNSVYSKVIRGDWGDDEMDTIFAEYDSFSYMYTFSEDGVYDFTVNAEFESIYPASDKAKYLWNLSIEMVATADSVETKDGWYVDGIYYPRKSVGFVISDLSQLQNGDWIKVNNISYVQPLSSLMPPIYFESDGYERFYNASAEGVKPEYQRIWTDEHGVDHVTNINYNDKYLHKDESGELVPYIYKNPYRKGFAHEHKEDFSDIFPTIEGVENIEGNLIGKIVDVDFDSHDDDTLRSETEANCEDDTYNHPYFYIKLNKTAFSDSEWNFNLFNQAIENETMKVCMTSGDCAGCEFEVVASKFTGGDNGAYYFKNPVQIDEATGRPVEGDWQEKTSYSYTKGTLVCEESPKSVTGIVVSGSGDTKRYTVSTSFKYKANAVEGCKLLFRPSYSVEHNVALDPKYKLVPRSARITYGDIDEQIDLYGNYEIPFNSSGEIGFTVTLLLESSDTFRDAPVSAGSINLTVTDLAASQSVWSSVDGGFLPTQQDTSAEDVWLILSKENSTYSQVMPNCSGGYRPKVGDTFVITGINMPSAFIRAAEERLEEALIMYMREHNEEKFTFSAKFSRVYINSHEEFFDKLNENSYIPIRYNRIEHKLYVTSYTCKADDNCLYDVSIELGEEFAARENALTRLLKAQTHEAKKDASRKSQSAKRIANNSSNSYTDAQINKVKTAIGIDDDGGATTNTNNSLKSDIEAIKESADSAKNDISNINTTLGNLDGRYIRRDANDNNGGNTLTVGKLAIGSSPLVEWDSDNKAFKFNASIYSTGEVSAYGAGQGGSGGGLSWEDLAEDDATRVIHSSHVPLKTLVVNGTRYDLHGNGDVTVEGGGASSFGELSGSPYDNFSLAGALDGKSDNGHTHTTSNITDLESWGSKFLTSVSWIDLQGSAPNISIFNNNVGYAKFEELGNVALWDNVEWVDIILPKGGIPTSDLAKNSVNICGQDVALGNKITSNRLFELLALGDVARWDNIAVSDIDDFPTDLVHNNGNSYNISITGNANSATSLQTYRSLWGNNFNGSADVNGDIRFGLEGEEGAERHIFFGANIADNAGFHFNANGWGVYDWLNDVGVIRYYSKDPSPGFNQRILYSGVTWSLLNGELQIGDYKLTATADGLEVSHANGTAANLYATGDVAAYGAPQGSVSPYGGLATDNVWSGKNTFENIAFEPNIKEYCDSIRNEGADYLDGIANYNTTPMGLRILSTTFRGMEDIVKALTWLLWQYKSEMPSK